MKTSLPLFSLVVLISLFKMEWVLKVARRGVSCGAMQGHGGVLEDLHTIQVLVCRFQVCSSML